MRAAILKSGLPQKMLCIRMQTNHNIKKAMQSRKNAAILENYLLVRLIGSDWQQLKT